jgi:hypothetical protein
VFVSDLREEEFFGYFSVGTRFSLFFVFCNFV